MTRGQYTKAKNNIREKIKALEAKLDELDQQYIEANAEFEIDEKVLILRKSGITDVAIIRDIRVCRGTRLIEYDLWATNKREYKTSKYTNLRYGDKTSKYTNLRYGDKLEKYEQGTISSPVASIKT